jgi:hypothetical protein
LEDRSRASDRRQWEYVGACDWCSARWEDRPWASYLASNTSPFCPWTGLSVRTVRPERSSTWMQHHFDDKKHQILAGDIAELLTILKKHHIKPFTARTRFIARRAKGLFQSHLCPRAILPTVRTGPLGAHEPTVDMQN